MIQAKTAPLRDFAREMLQGKLARGVKHPLRRFGGPLFIMPLGRVHLVAQLVGDPGPRGTERKGPRIQIHVTVTIAFAVPSAVSD